MSHVNRDGEAIKHYGKITRYTCGFVDLMASTSPDFGPKGYEAMEDYGRPKAAAAKPQQRRGKPKGAAEDIERSMRRARAKVRRIALSNDMKWFVTLTLSPEKVDRYDGQAVIKKLNQWCSNQVKRKGLKYVLVPERHKDGAIHFHGFFNDALEAVASGHTDSKGHMMYNIPAWTLGFTTAIEVYGDYAGAVAYVCKYIGKQGDKPCGRWYYSGGDLMEPEVIYAEIDVNDLVEEYGGKVWKTYVPGRTIAVLNGLREE